MIYVYIYHYNKTSTFNLVASYANKVMNICRKIKMELNIINYLFIKFITDLQIVDCEKLCIAPVFVSIKGLITNTK